MVFNHYISRLTGVEYENSALHCWGLSKIQNQKWQLTLPTDSQSMLTLNVRRGLKAQSCCFIKLPQLDGPAWSEMRHPRITLLRDLGCQVWNKFLEMEHFDEKKRNMWQQTWFWVQFWGFYFHSLFRTNSKPTTWTSPVHSGREEFGKG